MSDVVVSLAGQRPTVNVMNILCFDTFLPRFGHYAYYIRCQHIITFGHILGHIPPGVFD